MGTVNKGCKFIDLHSHGNMVENLMKTVHSIHFADARRMTQLADNSIDLMVTSPPYPMIEMWDNLFQKLDSSVKKCLSRRDGPAAFEAIHRTLDPVWQECFRVLKPGGFACINIGDATRSIDNQFALYTNHARILSAAGKIGFTSLPCIIWRKQTNVPNKFMGSGMLPAGAYVTLEHEYILILRKHGKREFTTEKDKQRRRESAIFWEERNHWFSDVWFDLAGTPQALADARERKRSAAFPFELAYRLINMFSLQADQVLDPFMGTGTTLAAAMAAGRSSVGYEMDKSLVPAIHRTVRGVMLPTNQAASRRLIQHQTFVEHRAAAGKPLKYVNETYGFPVVTNQEKWLHLHVPVDLIQADETRFQVAHDLAEMPFKYNLFDN
jgi:DNA modification methylase